MPQRLESYWERGVALEKPARDIPARVDVLVVGAGFMGLWLAYWLSKLKPALAPGILVVDRDLLAYGASSRNAGFLTSGNISEMLADSLESGRQAVFSQFEKRRAGLEIALSEFPDLPSDRCGSADFDPITPGKRELHEALNTYLGAKGQAHGFAIEPAVFSGQEREVFFNSKDRGVNPVDLLVRLRAACRSRGVQFAYGVSVKSASAGKAVCELRGTEAPATLAYGHGFLCVNAFASSLHAGSQIVPGRGQVIVTSPVAALTSHHLGFLDDGYDYFKFVDGRLLIGGGRHKFRAREETEVLEPSAELREYLTGRAREVIGHDRFTVDYHWAGIMGFPGGRHTNAEHRVKLDASTDTLNACGGMGVALTPLVGRTVALEFVA